MLPSTDYNGHICLPQSSCCVHVPACMSRKRSNDLYFHCTFKGILYRDTIISNRIKLTAKVSSLPATRNRTAIDNHASLATYLAAHNQELLRGKQIK